MIVVGRRGRPPSPDPKYRVSTRVRTSQYDTLVKMASELDKSVCELAGEILARVAERNAHRYRR